MTNPAPAAAAKCSPLAVTWNHPYRREHYDARTRCESPATCERYPEGDVFAIFADTTCTKA